MAPFPDYPVPADEEERLRTLERVLLLDRPADEHLDRITELAAAILDKPIALISLVDQERQWFLSRQGLDATETPREMAFCAHAIADCKPLVVPDASLDPRFNSNPLVLEDPSIRFYAGMPLLAANGQPLGTICVIDRQPGSFSDRQLHLLQLLAAQVTREVAMREMSSRCALTGLFHRAPFLFLAGKEFERARRTGTSLALVSVAAPHLQTAAELSGQEAVERLLIELGDNLRASTTPADLLGRVGSDQFSLLLVEADAERACQVCNALQARQAVSADSNAPQRPLRFAITSLQPDDTSFVELLIRAENSLFLARSGGATGLNALGRS